MQDSQAQAPAAPSVRVRTFLKGIVYYDNRRVSIDCTVRDLSESGARVALNSQVTIPDNIELFIPQKDRVYRAMVRRRDAFEIGISFEEHRSAEPRRAEDAGVNERIALLEQEIVQLRKIVRKLRDKVLPNDIE